MGRGYRPPVGGLAWWLDRRSWPANFPYPVQDWRPALWPLSGWSVRYQSTNMVNSASHLSGVGLMSSNPLMMDTKVGTNCCVALPIMAGGRAAARIVCVQAVGGGRSGLAAQLSDESALEVCIHIMRYTNRRFYLFYLFYSQIQCKSWFLNIYLRYSQNFSDTLILFHTTVWCHVLFVVGSSIIMYIVHRLYTQIVYG